MAGPHMMPIIELRPHYNVAGNWEETDASEGSGDLTSGQIAIAQVETRIITNDAWFNPPAANSDVVVTMRMFFDGVDYGFGIGDARVRLQAYEDQRGYIPVDQPIAPDFINPNDLWDEIFLDGNLISGPPCGSMQPWELTKAIDKNFWNANFTPGKYISFQADLPRPDPEEAETCSPGEWFELLLTFEPSFDFAFVPSNDAPATLQWVTTRKVPLASNGNMRYVFAEQRYDPVTGTYVTIMRSNNKVFYGGLGTGIDGSSVSQTRIEYRPTIVRYETNSPCTQL